MADTENPFAGLADTSDAGGLRQEPLSDNDRLIVQNLYDTQPKRRAEYLKQIGFELDPSNSNMIRPLGSNGSFDVEIDPGISKWFKKGGLKEFWLDIRDLQTDVLKGQAIVGGATAGGAAGTAVGGALGGVPALVLGPLGAVLGGGAGSAAAEEAKRVLGDTLLQKEVPMDRRLQIAGALIDGVLPQAVKGAGKLGRGVLDSKLLASKQAAVNALKAGGGVGNQEMIDYAVKNPEKFTPEAVKGANSAYRKTFKDFFGLEPNQFGTAITDFDRIPTDSVFGQQIKPVKDAAASELAKLSANRSANVSAADIRDQILPQITQLSSMTGKKDVHKDALQAFRDYYKDFLGDVSTITGQKVSTLEQNPALLDNISLPYGEARKQLSVLQEKAFIPNAAGFKAENPILASVAGKARIGLDQIAEANGSKLPQLNAVQSDILSTWNTAQDKLKPENLFQAYTGSSKTAAGDIRDFVANEIDAKYGTQWAPQFEEASAKKYFESAFKNTGAKGSRELNASMIQEALKQGGIGAAAGATTGAGIGAIGPGTAAAGAGIGGLVGGAAGAIKGAAQAAQMANPEIALRTIAEINQKLAQPAGQTFERAISSAVAPQVSRELAPIIAPEEENPFAGLGD